MNISKSYLLAFVTACPLVSCVPSQVTTDQRTEREISGSRTGDQQKIEIDSTYSYYISLNDLQKNKIGQQIFQNETGGDYKKLVHWNQGEDFPSLGIAHFIWIPRSANVVFSDSFKGVIQQYVKLGYSLPAILRRQAPNYECPWQSSSEFWAQRSSPEVMELQYFLESTMNVQLDYVIDRVSRDLPKIFSGLTTNQKELINRNINNVISSDASWYPIIDYLNFKGSGSKFIETTASGGWGLRQVLFNMNPNASSPQKEFADSAYEVLERRTVLRSQDRMWLPGWRKRVSTYETFKLNNSGF